jgi:hypothetical protein
MGKTNQSLNGASSQGRLCVCQIMWQLDMNLWPCLLEADAVPGLSSDQPEIPGFRKFSCKIAHHNITWQAVIFWKD